MLLELPQPQTIFHEALLALKVAGQAVLRVVDCQLQVQGVMHASQNAEIPAHSKAFRLTRCAFSQHDGASRNPR